MKEIYQNDNFHIRTDEQQEIINLICDNFPSSGFPRQILLLDNIICISSYLGYMSIGFKHFEYEFEYGRKSNRICIYKVSDLSIIFKQDLEFSVNSILKIEDKILLGTGVYGDQPKGELLEVDLKKDSFKTCTGRTIPISFLSENLDSVEIFTYFPTGYYEGENRIYKLDKNSNFEIDFQSINPDRLITDDELEEMYNKEEDTVTVKNLNRILSFKNASH
jgi:hypothetical protein